MKIYAKPLPFLRNPAVQKEIQALDPVKDHCRIVYLMTGYEFPWDSVRALEIALFRTFCSPNISRLLHKTGEFHHQGKKRYDDTALLIAEFMQNGYDSERGREAIARMNHIHGHFKIENEDFLFVLATFIYIPFRWIERFGWRKVSDNERLALYYFFYETGKRMNIKDIPTNIDSFESFLKDYENRNFVYSDTNKAVADSTINIVKGWLPFFLRPFVPPILKCFLDEKMLLAFSYRKPSPLIKTMLAAAMKIRAFALRYFTFMRYPYFFNEAKNRTYPKGYTVKNLLPSYLSKKD